MWSLLGMEHASVRSLMGGEMGGEMGDEIGGEMGGEMGFQLDFVCGFVETTSIETTTYH